MSTSSSLNIILGATLGPLQKGLKKGVGLVKNFTATASKAFTGGGVGNAIAGAIGGATFTAAVGYSVKKFAEIESASTQLNAALAGNGNQAGVSALQVRTFADELLRTTGAATTATMAAGTALAQFQQVKGPNFTQTIQQAKNYTAVMGGDLVSATAKLGAALQNPREGYLELAAAGVGFSAAQVDAIQSMQRAGDIAGAQTVILEAMQAQYGGLAELAGNTLTGSLDKAHASIAAGAAIIGEALAPAIKVGVSEFQHWLNGLDQAEVKNEVLGYTAQAVGWIVDGVQMLKIVWKAAQVVVNGFVTIAVAGFKWVVVGVEKVIAALEMLPGVTKDAGDSVRSFLKDVEEFETNMGLETLKAGEDLVNAWEKPWESKRSTEFFERVRAEATRTAKQMGDAVRGPNGPVAAVQQLTKAQIEAQAEATRMVRDLEFQLDAFGKDSYHAKYRELISKGATHNQAADVSDQMAKLQGKELKQALETPFEKLDRELKLLDGLKATKAIDDETYARSTAAMTQKFIAAMPQTKASAGGALMQGSQEARSALMAYRNTERSNNPAEVLKRSHAEQKALLETANKYLGEIAEAAHAAPAPAGPGY